jgi:hypothetical protein
MYAFFIKMSKLLEITIKFNGCFMSIHIILYCSSYDYCLTIIKILCDMTSLKVIEGPSWSWSGGSWIYDYLCNQCLSPLTLCVRIPLRRGVLDTTLCNKVCQWLAAGSWFSLGTDTTLCDKVCKWLTTGWWFSLYNIMW